MMNCEKEKPFIRAQIAEIQKYLKEHPHENQNQVVLRWIDRYAAEFRTSWKEIS